MSLCLNCGHSDQADFQFCPRCGTRAAEVASDPLLGRTLNNKYRVEQKIGSGAMGTVYLGEHIGLKKKVALKVLHSDLQVRDDVLQRFQREGIAAGKFNHPHAIQIFDFDRAEGRLFYLAMEYVEGSNLTQLLLQRGKLDRPVAVDLARQLLSCLVEAHRHGIVHRDLKPDNIMIVESQRGDLRLKVLDFGLSRLLHRRMDASLMTQTGRILGTPLYMAPEQISGGEADAQSDLYAAGLILYEMLAGARPWKEVDLGDVWRTRIHREAPSIAEDHPDLQIPLELDQVIATALERDRDRRFASAEEMLERLETVPLEARQGKGRARALVSSGRGSRASSRASSRTERRAPDQQAAPARPRWLWIGVGALLLLGLGVLGWNLSGGSSGSRPSRVRMIAEDDRSEIENRYLSLLDEAKGSLRSRDTAAAMRALDQALGSPSHDAEALHLRAEVYAAKGDPDMALADYRAASQADPGFLAPLLGMAWLYFDRGDLEAAERTFSEATSIEPDSGDAIAGQAALAWRRGDAQKAEELVGRALVADPTSARANRYAGRLRLDQGDADRAIARLVEAKRADPSATETLAWLGEAYLARERFDEADAQFEEALATDANLPRVRQLRGSLLLERGRTNEAAEFLGKAVERHPADGALWVLQGIALLASGNGAGAAQALQRGIELGERSPEAQALLGILHQREGRLDQARAQFESLVKSGTEMPLAFLNLGLVLFEQGEYEQAAEQLASVLVLDEKNTAAHLHLGLLYMDYLGNPEQARVHLTRYLELGGSDSRVQGWLDRLP